jgi:hypothetical protein
MKEMDEESNWHQKSKGYSKRTTQVLELRLTITCKEMDEESNWYQIKGEVTIQELLEFLKH